MHFSIITITKNNPIGFAKTEHSIQAQTYKNYEWIVVDGVVEPDNGIYDAMNKGIVRANGDYLIFMNAGDKFASESVLGTLNQYRADFIYGDEAHKKSKHISRLNYGMITHHQSMVYKRAIIGDLRYDEKYKIAADYKFTLDYVSRCHSSLYLPLVLSIFEDGGVSQQNAKQGRLEQIEIRRELEIQAPPTPYRQWLGQMAKVFKNQRDNE